MTDPWTAPEGQPLPHFIICGAMKCGTTTLHHLLGSHPRVCMAKGELHFFDIDSPLQHGDFSFRENGRWVWQDMARDPARLWAWYADRFKDAGAGQLRGEDSTTYLASPIAFRRIAAQREAIKLVVVLRDPVARAWSHYWHWVRTGRATRTFADTLRYEAHTVLERGMYLDQLIALFTHVPRERVHVVVFEEFILDRDRVVDGLCRFLGIDAGELPERALDTHSNRATMPRWPGLQLLKNRWFRGSGNRRYLQRLPFGPEQPGPRSTLIDRIHGAINPVSAMPPPRMDADTRNYLTAFYRSYLDGLDELLGQPVTTHWWHDDQKG